MNGLPDIRDYDMANVEQIQPDLLTDIPVTPLLPGDISPSVELIEALQKAVSYTPPEKDTDSSLLTQNTPMIPLGPSILPGSKHPVHKSARTHRFGNARRATRTASSNQPKKMRNTGIVVPRPNGDLFSTSTMPAILHLRNGWAEDIEAANLIEENNIRDVVIGTEEMIDFLERLDIVSENDRFVLVDPKLMDCDEDFIDIIERQSNIIFDSRKYFERKKSQKKYAGLSNNGAHWSYIGGLKLTQRFLDMLYFQQRCCHYRAELLGDDLLRDTAAAIECDRPYTLLLYLLSESEHFDEIRNMLETAELLAFPSLIDVDWLDSNKELVSEEVRRITKVAEDVYECVLASIATYDKTMNVLMPTDSISEMRAILSRLGSEMGAVKLLDERLDGKVDDEKLQEMILGGLR